VPPTLDSKDRFSVTADAYDRYRPGYPAGLVDWICALGPLAAGARVVDLGCGTGISSRLFAERGFDVVGVEPNDDMRARAEAKGGGARYRRGEAAATGLPDASAELVIAAQAFHWFDVPAAMREIARLLVPGGWAAAFWNVRASSPFQDDYEDLLLTYSSEYRKMKKFTATVDAIRAFSGAEDVHEAAFEHPRYLDRDAFFGLVASSSYVMHGISDRADFDRQLVALFDRYVGPEGTIDFATRNVVIAWRLRR
jgi:SAM-dependent methyltransferase